MFSLQINRNRVHNSIKYFKHRKQASFQVVDLNSRPIGPSQHNIPPPLHPGAYPLTYWDNKYRNNTALYCELWCNIETLSPCYSLHYSWWGCHGCSLTLSRSHSLRHRKNFLQVRARVVRLVRVLTVYCAGAHSQEVKSNITKHMSIFSVAQS